jgi:hypothetical protein
MVWNKHLNNDIKNLEMLCSQMSSKSMKLINMFMWKNTNKSYVIVRLYVDNILFWATMITWSNIQRKY